MIKSAYSGYHTHGVIQCFTFLDGEGFITGKTNHLPPKRNVAVSNDKRVRVDGSKKQCAIDFIV